MFKQILLTVATTILTTGIGLNFTSNIKLQENIERQNIEIQSDNQINYWFNNDHSDKILRLETKYLLANTMYLITTIDFGTNDPTNFVLKEQNHTNSKIFTMHWGKDTFNYNNKLISNNRNKNITKNAKIKNKKEVDLNTKWLMRHEEKDFIAWSAVTFMEGFSFYIEEGNFYVQWLVKFAVEKENSFSSVFSAISLGSNLLFVKK